MVIPFTERKVEINDRRRENKKRSDLLQKEPFKHEVSLVYNTFYREQVSSLYRAVKGENLSSGDYGV